MAGKAVATTIQINDSATASNNFVLKADNLGGLKLSRGNDGATSSDILTITSGDQVALPANTTNKLVSASGSAPVYGCRAWANFDGTLSGTINPRSSGNIASITKLGTGIYDILFATSMPDANYTVTAGCTELFWGFKFNFTSLTSAGFTLQTYGNNALADATTVTFSVIR